MDTFHSFTFLTGQVAHPFPRFHRTASGGDETLVPRRCEGVCDRVVVSDPPTEGALTYLYRKTERGVNLGKI